MKKLNVMDDIDVLESFKEICLELGSLDEMGWLQEVKKLRNTWSRRNNSHILKGNKNQTKQGTQKIFYL